MSAVPTLGVVALDCPDPAALAEFYRSVLEWDAPEVAEDGRWVTLPNPAGGAGIAFQRVPDYRPPAWPSAENPQQMHLDLNVTDLEAAHERVLGLGAKLLDDNPKTFRVYADPVGHPFCLCAC
ncbi:MULTISPECIES: VOC family protein [unclassified Amycolatopsis]|uniref:VOC family protein n=1 Tax=unclassified Amycolatopsis TaxID=2618356 RepID=UPI002874740A|nr:MULTISPECIES: VOC family protein [unclassified Amycolatopsis]MDS0132660.1 VOC family protein [Amycolatopsis sp. 505]MDS0142515.1 VOC family protein [Amycolatopsis sp. CM201R]